MFIVYTWRTRKYKLDMVYFLLSILHLSVETFSLHIAFICAPLNGKQSLKHSTR